MQIPSNKISLAVYHLLDYIAVMKKISRKEVVSKAVVFYKELFEVSDIQIDTPCQNPLLYPQPIKHVRLDERDRLYLDTLPTHCQKKAPEALDRVIMVYQNEALNEMEIPDHLRVNWMDKRYLNWMESCP